MLCPSLSSCVVALVIYFPSLSSIYLLCKSVEKLSAMDLYEKKNRVYLGWFSITHMHRLPGFMCIYFIIISLLHVSGNWCKCKSNSMGSSDQVHCHNTSLINQSHGERVASVIKFCNLKCCPLWTITMSACCPTTTLNHFQDNSFTLMSFRFNALFPFLKKMLFIYLSSHLFILHPNLVLPPLSPPSLSPTSISILRRSDLPWISAKQGISS